MARTRQAIRKTKTSSDQRDLEEKFARMRLGRTSEGNKPKQANKKKTSPKMLSSQQGGRRNTLFKEYEHGYAPFVPPLLYDYLQEAVGYIQHLETHKDDLYVRKCLEGVERCIQDDADFYSEYLPKDWKYERATAGKWQPIPYFSRASFYDV